MKSNIRWEQSWTYYAPILLQYWSNIVPMLQARLTEVAKYCPNIAITLVAGLCKNLYQGCFPIMEQHLRTISEVFSKFVTMLKQMCACIGSNWFSIVTMLLPSFYWWVLSCPNIASQAWADLLHNTLTQGQIWPKIKRVTQYFPYGRSKL